MFCEKLHDDSDVFSGHSFYLWDTFIDHESQHSTCKNSFFLCREIKTLSDCQIYWMLLYYHPIREGKHLFHDEFSRNGQTFPYLMKCHCQGQRSAALHESEELNRLWSCCSIQPGCTRQQTLIML